MIVVGIKALNILKWTARIWSAFSILFLSFFIVAHLFEKDGFQFNSSEEGLWFLCFPIGVLIGLLLCWKKEAWGAFLSLISLICFHLFSQSPLNLWIDGLSSASILFMVYAFLQCNATKNTTVK